jgi:hypothetical protein
MKLLGDHECGSRRNGSANGEIFRICKIMERKWEYKETVQAYDSVKRQVLYIVLKELGIPMQSVRLIKMCLNETHSKARIGKHFSHNFLIQNGLKQGYTSSPLFFKLFFRICR